MTNPLLRLRETADTLPPTEKAVAYQILKNPHLVSDLSIQELAKQTFSSASTVVRLCNHVGYPGYKAFRRAIALELAVKAQSMKEEQKSIRRTDSIDEIIDKITYRNIVSLEETRDLIDKEVLKRCIQMIKRANIIYLFGMGASLCAAKDLYLKFLRANKMCIINEDWHSQLLQARNATQDDLAIVFSYSGNTVEVIECMKALKENGTPSIAITRLVKSEVSDMADEKLYTASNESIFRTGAMSSRISQLNIIDILYTCLGNLENLEYEHYLDQLSRTHIHKPSE